MKSFWLFWLQAKLSKKKDNTESKDLIESVLVDDTTQQAIDEDSNDAPDTLQVIMDINPSVLCWLNDFLLHLLH